MVSSIGKKVVAEGVGEVFRLTLPLAPNVLADHLSDWLRDDSGINLNAALAGTSKISVWRWRALWRSTEEAILDPKSCRRQNYQLKVAKTKTKANAPGQPDTEVDGPGAKDEPVEDIICPTVDWFICYDCQMLENSPIVHDVWDSGFNFRWHCGLVVTG